MNNAGTIEHEPLHFENLNMNFALMLFFLTEEQQEDFEQSWNNREKRNAFHFRDTIVKICIINGKLILIE